MTKARACKGADWECNTKVTYTPENTGDCEGVNSHTPKWTPILGIGVH